ncbi:MAG: FAD-binding oxidoreductase, partial [Candidatus Thorarchaeota archaeon]|nr:FAD-binding oxidoreductase [Candidatus Thorarchaeota archaeon]
MLDSKTKKKLYDRLVSIVGEEHVTQQETDRVLNAHDCWPLSEAKIRAGELLPLADMIVFPASSEEISQILIVANDLEIPVIPVGGGAGTCGGTLAIYGGIQLDLKRMVKIFEIDHESMTVKVEAGVMGIDLEEEVN